MGVQNEQVYRAYHARNHAHQTGPVRELFMFHGCRIPANEQLIVHNGFSVAKCRSGGANYGTWLAYVAAYSDSGFAFDHADGQVMRVVGESCAYPLYILKYRRDGFPRRGR